MSRDREFNERLAKKINAFWAARGKYPNAYVVCTTARDNRGVKAHGIRSYTLGGLPTSDATF